MVQSFINRYDSSTLPDSMLASCLPWIIGANLCSLLIHLMGSAPSAGEATRGYLHGHLLIDFVGQLGPTSKYRLVPIDLLVTFLQLLFLSGLVAKKNAAARHRRGHVGHQDLVELESLDAEERSIMDHENMGSQPSTGRPSPEFNNNESHMRDLLFSGQFLIRTFRLIDYNMIQKLKMSDEPLMGASSMLNDQISADLRQSTSRNR